MVVDVKLFEVLSVKVCVGKMYGWFGGMVFLRWSKYGFCWFERGNSGVVLVMKVDMVCSGCCSYCFDIIGLEFVLDFCKFVWIVCFVFYVCFVRMKCGW